ncbi:MAG: TolC family protein [Bacteroidota bacterium]|nr:TolC family protein [Bacteroidota bacterium]
MKNRIIMLAILFLFSQYARAQHTVREVLEQVKQNNISLQKYQEYTSSRILESKTGLNPADPSFEIAYLWGSKSNTYLNEIGLKQEFDFPTAYTQRNKISTLQQLQYRYQQEKYCWEILQETKLLTIKMVYLYKKRAEYKARADLSGRLLSDQEKRLREGYGTSLEVEKARLHHHLIENDLQKIQSGIRTSQAHLEELNGGREISFYSMDYPVFDKLPVFDTLIERLEAVDPVNKIIEVQIKEADRKVSLSKAEALPGFEIGYRYEEEFLNKFNGVHFGISIPLWEDRNKVKHSRLKTDYLYAEIAEHENDHYYEIKETYESFLSAKERLNSLGKTLNELRFEDKLDKALNEGNIDRIDFYSEYIYLYDIRDELFETEKEYYMLLAELFKFKLLELTR